MLSRIFFFKVTGLRIYKKLPIGVDPFDDISYYLPDYPIRTYFDVGANIGQSVDHVRACFPSANIWCFEPIQETFNLLKKNTINKGVRTHQIALGAENKDSRVFLDTNEALDRNSLIHKHVNPAPNLVLEKIHMQTLDTFCENHYIPHIDYLKIDTEGYDLEVLRGSIKYLQDQAINFIEVEVGMNPENTFHVDFVAVKEFLEKYGYRLYGLYEQVHEWPTQTPILRRVNSLYISPRIYQATRSNTKAA